MALNERQKSRILALPSEALIEMLRVNPGLLEEMRLLANTNPQFASKFAIVEAGFNNIPKPEEVDAYEDLDRKSVV